MNLGIIIGTNEAEVAWNALRLGVASLKANHESKIFLINKGVEIDAIKDEKYNVSEQLALFVKGKGQLLACGTCMKSRQKSNSTVCPPSTMDDLLKLIEDSDKILTFG